MTFDVCAMTELGTLGSIPPVDEGIEIVADVGLVGGKQPTPDLAPELEAEDMPIVLGSRPSILS